jgi:hypothetical protein
MTGYSELAAQGLAAKPGEGVVKPFTPHGGALERVPCGDPHNGYEWAGYSPEIGTPVIKAKGAQ